MMELRLCTSSSWTTPSYPSACAEGAQAKIAPERRAVSDGILAKLVVIVIVLIGLTIWPPWERRQSPGCENNCPTDISASRK
jgi:hypothetical protein